MTPKEYIEKIIAGGGDLLGRYQNDEGLGYPTWEYKDGVIVFHQTRLGFAGCATPSKFTLRIEQLLLDKKSWEAVGKGLGKNKVCNECGEGFKESRDNCLCGTSYSPLVKWGEYAMHHMVVALFAGKSIEEFLATL